MSFTHRFGGAEDGYVHPLCENCEEFDDCEERCHEVEKEMHGHPMHQQKPPQNEDQGIDERFEREI